MSRTLTQLVLAEGDEDAPLVPVSRRGRPDEYVRVTLRLHRQELAAIDAPLRLGRNEWIKRAIRWQLWDRAGVLRLCPATAAV